MALPVAYPSEEVQGVNEGDRYLLCDEHGQSWDTVLVQRAGSWFLVTDDGVHVWPFVSLWRWRALSRGTCWLGAGEASDYTFWVVGAAAPGAWALVESLMESLNSVLLVDMRAAARSRWFPHWNKSRLLARWGSRYTHEQGLSNRQYRDTGTPIELVDPVPAVAGVVGVMLRGYVPVLLCGCRGDDPACSCRVVIGMVEERLRQARREASPLHALGKLFRRSSS